MSYPNPSTKSDELIQVIGTIAIVEPLSLDPSTGQYVQKVVIQNALAVNNPINLPPRLLITVRVIGNSNPIPFRVNDPITVKGFYKQLPPDFLSYMYNTHAPSGYIRYSGKIYT